MAIIASTKSFTRELSAMLEAYDCPAILVSSTYEILGSNKKYESRYGSIDQSKTQHCFNVSHGYSVPCDQAGESCPLKAALDSKHLERVLHVHQTPRGKEHVDIEMLPIFDEDGELLYFVELLHEVPTVSAVDQAGSMVGTSEPFNKMLGKIARLSGSDASVLLLGKSGSGKELAAKAVHFGSERKAKPLVTVECSGLTESLFESELFGHIKGAFTGAHGAKVGLVETVKGGTLFLDEIGDVPLSMQVKLLRLIETGTFRAVGSSEVQRADFRLVCATHRNILQMVMDGMFRQDLFYRINVFPVKIPTLNERVEDIPLLASSILKSLSPQKDFFFTDSAIQMLKGHSYVGNIRELKNILDRAIVLTDTNIIEASTIKECFSMDFVVEDGLNSKDKEKEESIPEWVDLKTAEKKYIEQLMQAHNDDKEVVARIAGVSIRSLYRKLDLHL